MAYIDTSKCKSCNCPINDMTMVRMPTSLWFEPFCRKCYEMYKKALMLSRDK